MEDRDERFLRFPLEKDVRLPGALLLALLAKAQADLADHALQPLLQASILTPSSPLTVALSSGDRAELVYENGRLTLDEGPPEESCVLTLSESQAWYEDTTVYGDRSAAYETVGIRVGIGRLNEHRHACQLSVLWRSMISDSGSHAKLVDLVATRNEHLVGMTPTVQPSDQRHIQALSLLNEALSRLPSEDLEECGVSVPVAAGLADAEIALLRDYFQGEKGRSTPTVRHSLEFTISRECGGEEEATTRTPSWKRDLNIPFSNWPERARYMASLFPGSVYPEDAEIETVEEAVYDEYSLNMSVTVIFEVLIQFWFLYTLPALSALAEFDDIVRGQKPFSDMPVTLKIAR
jgi:hypothetical protein